MKGGNRMLHGMDWDQYVECGFGIPVREEDDPCEYEDAHGLHAEGKADAD